MPLDHYVSQVHLRNFYSPGLGDRFYAIRKSDLKSFTPNSKVVCGINDGSTNAYLRDDREIEEFLQTIEPNYDAAVEKLITKKIDMNCIYTIAGFVAYIVTCAPAGMRIRSGPLKGMVENTGALLDAKGLLPPSPSESEFGGASLTELIERGTVKVTIDPKYPQAIGIGSIRTLTATFGNFSWEILRNDFDDCPFFTSDFPVAIERTADPRVLNRIVPLTPSLALRIIPDLRIDSQRVDFSFANFRFCSRKVSHRELVQLNRLLVRCAEDAVFYRDDRPWVRPFIIKNRHYRIEPSIEKLRIPNGILQVATQRVSISNASVGHGEEG